MVRLGCERPGEGVQNVEEYHTVSTLRNLSAEIRELSGTAVVFAGVPKHVIKLDVTRGAARALTPNEIDELIRLVEE